MLEEGQVLHVHLKGHDRGINSSGHKYGCTIHLNVHAFVRRSVIVSCRSKVLTVF